MRSTYQSLADEAWHEELNALQSAMHAFTARLASRLSLYLLMRACETVDVNDRGRIQIVRVDPNESPHPVVNCLQAHAGETVQAALTANGTMGPTTRDHDCGSR